MNLHQTKKILPGLGLHFAVAATGALFLCPIAPANAANHAKEIIRNVQKKYDELKSLKVDFRQDIKWELTGETQTVQGTFYLQRGNKYRMETETQEIVTDGETMWTLYKKSGQIVINNMLGDFAENPFPWNMLLKNFEEYEPVFVREENMDGRKTYLLNLVLKDEDTGFKSMKIWVDASDWFARKFERVDINDNVDTYLMQNLVGDVELDPSFFKFAIPGGSEVLDMR